MYPLGFNGLIECRLLNIFEPDVCPVWIMWSDLEFLLSHLVSNTAECGGSLGNPWTPLSPLNSFNTFMLTSQCFPRIYTVITSDIFLIIWCGPAQYNLNLSKLSGTIFESKIVHRGGYIRPPPAGAETFVPPWIFCSYFRIASQ